MEDTIVEGTPTVAGDVVEVPKAVAKEPVGSPSVLASSAGVPVPSGAELVEDTDAVTVDDAESRPELGTPADLRPPKTGPAPVAVVSGV